MGDLSQIMPVIHPYTAGATGGGHSRNYRIKDYEQAVVMPAKIMAMTAVDLLADGGVKARQAVEEFQPPMTRDQYVAFRGAGSPPRLRRSVPVTVPRRGLSSRRR